jgi:hypothetical protein
MKRWPNWMRGSAEPDEVIGDHEMLRWWALPRNSRFNVYLHRHRGNDPRTPHDHPCDNVSIRLRGQLLEYTPDDIEELANYVDIDGLRRVLGPTGVEVWFSDGQVCETGRPLPRIRRRRATDAHRLEVVNARPAWTLWIRFRNRRQWGYFEPGGWRPAVTARQPAS